MADTDLPISGKDCTVVLTYDGIPQAVAELVEVDIDKMIETSKTRPIGTTTTLISTDFDGWRIRLRLDSSRPGASQFADLITSGELLRVPSLVGLKISKVYRNFDKKSDTYLDLKLSSYSERTRRNEANRIELTLETGLNRIAS